MIFCNYGLNYPFGCQCVVPTKGKLLNLSYHILQLHQTVHIGILVWSSSPVGLIGNSEGYLRGLAFVYERQGSLILEANQYDQMGLLRWY